MASRLPAPVFSTLQPLVNKQLTALAAAQQPDGRWRTVLNNPNAYVESSSAGLITFAMTLHLACATDYPDTGTITRGFYGIWRQIAPDGALIDVQGPTGPLSTEAEYSLLPKTAPQLYGQAVGMLNALRTPRALCHPIPVR